jgi:hypothetical protein
MRSSETRRSPLYDPAQPFMVATGFANWLWDAQ